MSTLDLRPEGAGEIQGGSYIAPHLYRTDGLTNATGGDVHGAAGA